MLIFFTEVIKFYWLMLLLYPGELYRLLGASSLFCAIAMQSIKLELPPFFLFCTIALQSIKLKLPPFFYFPWLHCNLLNWSYLPFLFCAIAYLKFSKFIKLRSISLVQSSVLLFRPFRLFVLNQTLFFRFLIFQIFWLYLHWWDITCWNDHLQNLN